MNQVATLIVDSRCALGEGIAWDDRRQCLFWTDILSARLWSHVPATGMTHAWDLPEPLGCLALCDSGELLLALAKSVRIGVPVPGEPLQLRKLVDIEPELCAATRSNDGRCDRDGNFVFGTKDERGVDPPIGRLYQFSTRHGLRPLDLPALAIPNSICFSPDGRRLHFCDSREPRILCGDYDPEAASVSNVRLFASSADGHAPDGSSIDADGGLWNAQWDGARVVRYDADGCVDQAASIPAGRPSCCCIGGEAFDTLYVTTAREDLDAAALAAAPTAGGVFALPLPAGAGRPEARFATR